MSYPRQNTLQTSATSGANAAAVVKLPSTTTIAPGDETNDLNPIGVNQRWRIHTIIASYSAAPTAGSLVITDGVFTWTIDVPTAGPVPIPSLDLQCAPGAEVDITLSAAGSAVVGHLNVSVTCE